MSEHTDEELTEEAHRIGIDPETYIRLFRALEQIPEPHRTEIFKYFRAQIAQKLRKKMRAVKP